MTIVTYTSKHTLRGRCLEEPRNVEHDQDLDLRIEIVGLGETPQGTPPGTPGDPPGDPPGGSPRGVHQELYACRSPVTFTTQTSPLKPSMRKKTVMTPTYTSRKSTPTKHLEETTTPRMKISTVKTLRPAYDKK